MNIITYEEGQPCQRASKKVLDIINMAHRAGYTPKCPYVSNAAFIDPDCFADEYPFLELWLATTFRIMLTIEPITSGKYSWAVLVNKSVKTKSSIIYKESRDARIDGTLAAFDEIKQHKNA